MSFSLEQEENHLPIDLFLMEDDLEPEIYQTVKPFPADRAEIVFDRIIPPNSPEASNRQKHLMAFSQSHQIPLFLGQANTAWILSERESGIWAENAEIRNPLKEGQVVVGTTEDLIAAGAIGALGIRLSAEQMTEAFRKGSVILPKQRLLKIRVIGQPEDDTTVKGAVLQFLTELSEKVCSLKNTILLLTGEVSVLSQDSRIQILETLGRTEITSAYFDENAIPDSTSLTLDLSNKEALAAASGNYTDIQKLGDLPKTKITTVYIGGSSGGGLSELRLTAELLKGRKIAYGVRLSVAPATAELYIKAADEGWIEDIMDAGGLFLNQCARPENQARIGANEIMVSNDLENANGYAGLESSRTIITGTYDAILAALNGTIGERKASEIEEEQKDEDMVLEGRTWKFGNDIDTDIIIPTQHLSYPTMDEIKKHAFEPLRPELAAKLCEGDIIVAGSNFGCGSSREQAAEVILANGIHCIVAKSFARIFFRNAINNGILLIECQNLADNIQEGDRIRVDLRKHEITANGVSYPIAEIPENLYRIIADGGLVKNVQKRMKKQGEKA